MTYDSTTIDGVQRVFALHPRYAISPWLVAPWNARLGSRGGPAIIPRKDWPKEGVDFSDEVGEILDQKQFSLCHSFGGTVVNEIAQRRAGRKDVLLSAGNLAGQVTGYRDAGAAIQEVLPVLRDKGQCPRSLVEQYDYRGRNWPKGWEAEAAKFRAAEVYDCGQDAQTFDAIVSCLIYGWPVLLGTAAFGGGHAVAVVGYSFDGGNVRLFGPNSWGLQYKTWDKPGYWSYLESQLRDVASYGAFGFQIPVLNPDDVPPEVT